MITVLLLEGDPAEREALQDCLQQAGCRCLAANEPDDVAASVTGDAVDVVILDAKAGGGAGLAVARRLRATHPDLPLILSVRMADIEAVFEAKRLGVIACLSRPIAPDDLIEAVEQAWQWRAARKRRQTLSLDARKEIAQRRAHLTKAFLQLGAVTMPALEALMMQLTSDDRAAGLHARRVARMAGALGWLLGLREPAVADIERGALLHDVGKIALPEAVARKSTGVSGEELALLRLHPRLGHEIVSVVSALQPAAEIVLTTHERYDGSGFPKALRARDIPLGARITAVVEAFDSWTVQGVSGAIISPESAATELVRLAGNHFDPDVVYAWLRMAEAPSLFLDDEPDTPALHRPQIAG